MGKQEVLQAAHEMSFKPLTGNRRNKIRNSRYTRRRQGMTFNIRPSVVPIANVLILLHRNAKNQSGFWSGHGSRYVMHIHAHCKNNVNM